MYGFVWRHLPGPWPARLLVFAAGIFGVIVLLFQYGFPAAEPHLPWSKDTVGTTVQQQVVGDYGTGSTPSNGTASTSSGGTGSAPAATGSTAQPTALPGD